MKRKFEQNMHKVGTLGPQGTSSEQAAIHFVQKTLRGKGTIILKESFENVFADLTEGHVDYALVPVAYPGINQFYMTQYIEDILSFRFDTPEYSLVTNKNDITKTNQITVALHPATKPLIPSLCKDYLPVNLVTVSSTAVAAKLAKDRRVDLAITNEESRKRHQLTVVKPWGRIGMSWIIFGNKNFISQGKCCI